MKFFPMINKVQNYPWGSKTAFSELFNMVNEQSKPMAEIWMGAHSLGSSSVILEDGQKQPLLSFIEQAPKEILSSAVYEQFGELPFLFKILAADSALSIQVHPSKDEAEEGYHRENLAGIPIDAFNRNYKDPNHKPELIYALTPYHAMHGFRIIDEIELLFTLAEVSVIQHLVLEFCSNKCSRGLEKLFVGLLALKGDELKLAVRELLIAAEKHQENHNAFATVLALSLQYPDDPGLFVPLMLNVVTLEPGQAMYLDARTPHSYIRGTGLEVMANSDNVLRAGLTSKYIDTEELAKCTLFEEKPLNTVILNSERVDNVLTYSVPVPDFKFAIFLAPTDKIIRLSSAEILLPLDADLEIKHENGERLNLLKGQSVFIPASTKKYTMTSSGRVARVYC